MLSFDPATHVYRLDGAVVPSVTQVLGEQLEDWSMVPRETLEAARLRGQRVHEAVALLLREDLDWDSLGELRPYLEGARNFLDDTKLVPLHSESALAHRVLAYAGTPDLIADYRADLSLFDFKSGSLPRSVGPQTAAYAGAYESCNPIGSPIKRRFGVQLNPSLPRGYKLHALTNHADWQVWLSALNCYRFRHGC